MKQSHNTLGILYTTVNDNTTGRHIIKALLEKRLIGCANIIVGVQSMYLWNDEICSDNEVIIILKTTKNKIPEVVAELQKIHPYDVPLIAELEISNLHSHSYLEWITKMLS